MTLQIACTCIRGIVRSLPANSNQCALRRYATHVSSARQPAHDQYSLAIVGGGLSGLSTAFYYLRALSPESRRSAKVVIFEKEHRVGGWCRSIDITSEEDVKSLDHTKGAEALAKGHANQKLIFETGPRSIRPVGLSGWLTVEMVSESNPSFGSDHDSRSRA